LILILDWRVKNPDISPVYFTRKIGREKLKNLINQSFD